MSGYVELHARSAFSFLQGASLPEELVAVAADRGLPALALLDHDGLYGSPRFHQAAEKAGLQAHIGAEVTGPGGSRYPLLVSTRVGYQNLCRLLTRMKLRAKKGEGEVTLPELEEHAPGLVCLTGDVNGPLAAALLRGGPEEARRCLEALQATFGKDNVYVELQRHQEPRQEDRNQALIELARSLGLPLLATNGVCHAQPGQRELLDVLTCIRHHTTLERAGRLLAVNRHRHVREAAQMQRLFADVPEAVAHTGELSSRLSFTLRDLGYEFPRYPVPDGETEASFLRRRTEEGARRRYRPYDDRAREQVERELRLIEKLRLAGYFLIVWDLVQFCEREGILVQGRGSAANSAVCYALGITAIDPVKMDLLFERFLSEERGEWPDIDLDLPSGDQRERAIQYVYRRYGERGAAMTANVITYRGRSAARDVGKAMGFDEAAIDRLSALSQGWQWTDPRDTAERRFAESGLDLAQPLVRKFLELFQAIQDLPRHLGQHSGGMVICQGQLDSVVPLEPASMAGRVVVQWDKDDCADLGLVKVDLLGLGMMAVLEESITLVRDAYGEELDLAHLPPDDPAVYAAMQKADTIGLFQVESRAQMATLPRLRPECFYDLVVEVAIIRPGPIVGKMVHPYIRRRQGLEEVTYPHPSLEPVLKRTRGLPLFQEQLLRMAMIVAGFTGGQAEELRRAFGHRRSERRMREVEAQLRAGMTANGIDPATQDTIAHSITGFALYGFPESHAASFALMAYASGYVKTHHLAAFTCALLNQQPMGFYHPATLVKDAQRHGLSFLPADVNASGVRCTVVPPGDGPTPPPGRLPHRVRLGLNYVRGLRAATAQALVLARERHGPYRDADDLARRVPALHRDEARQLARVGALQQAGARHRRDALWQVEAALRQTGPLLAEAALPGAEEEGPLAPMSLPERLSADYQGTGLTLGTHAMASLRAGLAGLRLTRSDALPAVSHGRVVTVAGGVICRQRPGTARGFFFLSLEDECGIINVIVTPSLYADHRAVWQAEPFLVIRGTAQNQEGVVSVKASGVRALRTQGLSLSSHDFH